MIVPVEAVYESGKLRLQSSLPLPEYTIVTALVKSPLGTSEEEDAWQFIQQQLQRYTIGGPFENLETPASHNTIEKNLLKVWESPDDNGAVFHWESRTMRDFFTGFVRLQYRIFRS